MSSPNRPGLRKELRTKVAVRLLGICFFGCATGFLLIASPYWLAGLWTGLITVALFFEAIRYVTQSERKLVAFLQALHQNDFAVTFTEKRNSDEYDLHRAFNQLNDIFKRLRSDRESEHQLLHVIVEQSGAPMICFDESNDEVYLVNNAAKSLLQIPFLQKVASLRRVNHELPEFIRNVRDGDKSSFKLTLGGKHLFLSVTACHIRFLNKTLKLVVFHDVSSELAAREAETWQKLLRVLTHEISNSAIPLSTLSSYIHDMVMNANQEDRRLTSEERDDVLESLRTIDQRSRSLKEFVQNFRAVNQIPEPHVERVGLADMVRTSTHLFSKELENANIRLVISPMDDVQVFADRNLTQQVLINLVKNAVESMSNMIDHKMIEVTSHREGHRFVHLRVRDTGGGIATDDLDQIFIPFYSTKKGGSGIGLSISQQIMQRQKGDISVKSELGRGSEFTLTFSC